MCRDVQVLRRRLGIAACVLAAALVLCRRARRNGLGVVVVYEPDGTAAAVAAVIR